MTQAYRLIHRVKPRMHEDIFGFLVRVAQRNHFKGGATNLLKHITGNNSTKVTNSNLHQVAHYCRNTLPEIFQLSGIERQHSFSEKMWHVEGHWVTKASFVSFRHPKVCALCLREDPYVRGIWSLCFYTVCAKHRVELVSVCPSCNKSLKWDRRTVQRCNCGYDLTTAPTTTSNSQEALMSGLITHSVGITSISDLPQLLNQKAVDRLGELSLDGLCKTIWFLGHCISQLGKYGTGHGHIQPRNKSASQMIGATFDLLDDWPNQLGNKLKSLSNRPPSTSSASLLDRLLGPAQNYLEAEINSPELIYLKIAYEQHVRSIWKSMGKRLRSANAANQLELDFE